jgi:peptidoglycan hydrolase CwlO-like protein
MFKKLLILTLGVVLVLGLLFGRRAVDYVSKAVGDVRESINGKVPVEYELDGIRGDVQDLKSEIHDAMHKVAKEEVKLDQLLEEINDKEQLVSKLTYDVRRLNGIAKSGETFVAHDGRQFGSEQVKTDLGLRFERLKTEQSTLGQLKQLHAVREKTLNATRQKMDKMIARKQQMEVDIANLESLHRLNEVAEVTSKLELDDSPFNQTNQRIQDLKTRLKVERKLLNVHVTAEAQIPLDAPQSQDITEEVDAFLNPQAGNLAASNK